MYSTLKETIERIWEHRELLEMPENIKVIEETINLLDSGKIRVAEPDGKDWKVNEWVKKAVILYFPTQKQQKTESGIFEYHDKIALKHDYDKLGVRVVPPATARYGAYLAKGVIMMPSYVNIGAYVDEGTMVDTWATVGSCAQIGKNVHLSGGVGIGGVLHRRQLLHRFALHSGRRRTYLQGSRPRRKYSHHRLNKNNRRNRKRTCRIQGLCPRTFGRNSR